jgi:hypothetical protein
MKNAVATTSQTIRTLKIMEILIQQMMMLTLPMILYKISHNLKWALLTLTVEWILKLMIITTRSECWEQN